MPAYITYMEVSLNSEGIKPRDLTETLKTLGWKPIYGRYDFVYEWDRNWNATDKNPKQFFDHVHKTHEALRGCHVNYSLRTYEQGTENFPTTWCE
jgi:hypothetical protein